MSARAWLRRRVPDAFAARLPEKRRRKHFYARLEAGQLHRLHPVLSGGTDAPLPGALFRAVDWLWNTDQRERLPELDQLAAREGDFSHAVWRALCDHAADRQERSMEALADLSRDDRFSDFERLCARAWQVFLRLPRLALVPGTREEGPAIFQYWDTPNAPEDVESVMRGWRDLAKRAYHRLDAARARDFLMREFGRAEVQIFDACAHPAIQSDYVRLAWLYRHGGLYIDADAKQRPGFAKVWPAFSGQSVVMFQSYLADGHFANGVFACPANAPLAGVLLEEAGRRISADPMNHVYALAGPGLFTEVLIELSEKGTLNEVSTISSWFIRDRVMTQIDAAYKQDDRGWHNWQKSKPWEQSQ